MKQGQSKCPVHSDITNGLGISVILHCRSPTRFEPLANCILMNSEKRLPDPKCLSICKCPQSKGKKLTPSLLLHHTESYLQLSSLQRLSPLKLMQLGRNSPCNPCIACRGGRAQPLAPLPRKTRVYVVYIVHDGKFQHKFTD